MNGNLEQKINTGGKEKGSSLGLVHVEDSVTTKYCFYLLTFFFHLGGFPEGARLKSLKSAIATQCGSRSELGDGLFPDNCLFPYM